MVKLTRKKQYQCKKRSIVGLLSARGRYISHKVKSTYKKLMKKEPKKLIMTEITLKSCKINQ